MLDGGRGIQAARQANERARQANERARQAREKARQDAMRRDRDRQMGERIRKQQEDMWKQQRSLAYSSYQRQLNSQAKRRDNEESTFQLYSDDSNVQNTFLIGLITLFSVASIFILIFYIFYIINGNANNIVYTLEQATNWMLFQITGLVILIMGILAGFAKTEKSSTRILIFASILILLIGYSDFQVLKFLNNNFAHIILSFMAIFCLVLGIAYIIQGNSATNR